MSDSLGPIFDQLANESSVEIQIVFKDDETREAVSGLLDAAHLGNPDMLAHLISAGVNVEWRTAERWNNY